jgi:hypothetical protein
MTLSDDDVQRLRTSLGPNVDLERIVVAVIRAGATEFLTQATGRVVPMGIREARLYRIFLLLQAGVTLAEAQALVAAIFKETAGRARGLVESAIARYDVELRTPVDARVAEILDGATWEENRWEVELPVGFVRERVLEVAAETPLADPTRAGRGAVYRFPDETYQAVRKQFGLKARAKPKQ